MRYKNISFTESQNQLIDLGVKPELFDAVFLKLKETYDVHPGYVTYMDLKDMLARTLSEIVGITLSNDISKLDEEMLKLIKTLRFLLMLLNMPKIILKKTSNLLRLILKSLN